MSDQPSAADLSYGPPPRFSPKKLTPRRVPWDILSKSLGRRSIFGMLVSFHSEIDVDKGPDQPGAIIRLEWEANPTVTRDYYDRFGIVRTARWLILIMSSYINNLRNGRSKR